MKTLSRLLAATVLLVACREEPILPSSTVPTAPRPQFAVAPSVSMIDLGTLGTFSDAWLINSTGQIVGQSQTLAGEFHAFSWRNGTISDLGTLGGVWAYPYALNNSGQIVGTSQTTGGNQHSFVWQNGTMTDLGSLSGGGGSYAVGINSAGQVAGNTSVGIYSARHGYFWQNGVMTDIGSLEGGETVVSTINDLGQIIGSSRLLSGTDHAFIWQNGAMTDLGTLGRYSFAAAINNAGQVVGGSQTLGGELHAFLWQNGVMTDLGSLGGYSYAGAINEVGQIVGVTRTASGDYHAFLWQNGVMTDIGTLGGYSEAFAINNVGQVVGFSTTPAGNDHAFLWQQGVMTDLGILAGYSLSYAYGINNLGQIVGSSQNPGGYSGRGVMWTVASPAQGIANMIVTVNALLANGTLSNGEAQALLAKLNAAASKVSEGNTTAAINLLQTFINKVQTDVKTGKLTAATGQALIDAAQNVIGQLGG